MKITVFGSTGTIGKSVVKQALTKGYNVKVYMRNPSKWTISHPNLEIVVGELNDYPKISQAISGTDAVISTLGPPLAYKYGISN